MEWYHWILFVVGVLAGWAAGWALAQNIYRRNLREQLEMVARRRPVQPREGVTVATRGARKAPGKARTSEAHVSQPRTHWN